METAICCGLTGSRSVAEHKDCVGPGWSTLLDDLAGDLEEFGEDYQVAQVKEKFGTLRAYIGPLGETGFGILRHYEDMSGRICEDCGQPGETRAMATGWIRTLCAACRDERNIRYCRG